jgi:hypothetical protein
MADGVRGQLAEIAGLIDRAEAAAADGADPEAEAEAPAQAQSVPAPEPEPRPGAAAPPRLRDELAAAVPVTGYGGEQSTLL